ncbi:MAG: ATP-binding protein [Candidatus Hodarchaeota archaeon]
MTSKTHKIVSFTPNLVIDDLLGSYWLQQVTLRLRREICWCRVERGIHLKDNSSYLPFFVDKESEILSMSKFSDKKREFMNNDTTAKHLTSLIGQSPPNQPKEIIHGSFTWLRQELNLNDASCFILALALLNSFDNAAGAIFASCLNDSTKNYPTLALAQRLWDNPEELYDLINPNHPLIRWGILRTESSIQNNFDMDWDYPLSVPTNIAKQLLFLDNSLIHGLSPVTHDKNKDFVVTSAMEIVTSRIKSQKKHGLKIVPLKVPLGGSCKDVLRGMSKLLERNIVEYTGDLAALIDSKFLNSIITLCWLKDVDLFFDPDILFLLDKQINSIFSLKRVSVIVFLGINQKDQLKDLPYSILSPTIDVPKFSYKERVNYWKDALDQTQKDLNELIQECSKTFRFEKKTIRSICQGLNQNKKSITKKVLFEACRLEVNLDDMELAHKVIPRFENEEIILPSKQQQQLQEIMTAMKSLTHVYYNWGLAKVWNESGISVLFMGPPGTGKTMAAEIIAHKLDLPIYKIDLSQVVNKYIGETEKNLKRIFDYAELSDLILFFDEADALFGKRTEVKDAHDRYANITVSYLLERLERFKGLAILATNKKENIDEAFKRRIRYIINFPMPGVKERKQIWKQVLPNTINQSSINIEFLARNFPLAGGNIRSIAFNACLQSVTKNNLATNAGRGRLSMKEIIIAIKREYEKIDKPVSLDQFGPYTKFLKLEEGGL